VHLEKGIPSEDQKESLYKSQTFNTCTTYIDRGGECSIRGILATTLVRHHDKIIIGIINDDVICTNEWTTHDSEFYWL
jgi:hypothetical protein